MFRQSRDEDSTVAGTASLGGGGLAGVRHIGGAAHASGMAHSLPRLLAPYPTTLNFYTRPPPYEIAIDEFEQLVLARLHVLKAIETIQLRANGADMTHALAAVLKPLLPLTSNMRVTGLDVPSERKAKAQALFVERKRDHISHFLLRLAYARTADLRQWFVRQEVVLFRHRYMTAAPEERQQLVSGLDLQVTTVSAKEKHRLMAQLQGAANATAEAVLAETYYRVPFENVLDLVAKRAVVLRDGWAYVPSEAQIVLVVNAFKKHLESALAETAKALPALEDDDRLHDMLRAVASQHLQSEYVASGSKNGVVGAADVDRLVNLFPPCMRQLHTHLRQDGHLRHQGRLQYWLFLKGIGMPVEEALTFWRKAFYRLTDDQFQKQYAYNLRHSYGIEGNRTNYTPFSCMKIITRTPPGPGEHHGCPFRHNQGDTLRGHILSRTSDKAVVNEIMALAKEQHYQLACTRLFEVTQAAVSASASAASDRGAGQLAARGNSRPPALGATGLPEPGAADADAGSAAAIITHPNQWFDLVRGAQEQGKVAASKTAPQASPSASGPGPHVPVVVQAPPPQR